MSPPSVPLSAIRQPAFLYGPDGRIADANDLAEALAGMPLAGCSHADIIAIFSVRTAAGAPLEPSALPGSRALAGEEVVEAPLSITAADGRAIEILATASALRKGGAVTGALAVWRDVTEHVKAVRELWENRAQYRALIETNVDFVWEMDASGRYTYCSPQIERLWGIRPEEMLGKTPFDLMPLAEREQALATFAEVAGAPAGFSGLETTSYDGRGNMVALEISGVPFYGDDGALLGFRGVTRDVTDRMQSEEALAESEADARSFMENMIDACAICETVFNERGELADIRLVDVNPAFARALSLPAYLLVGRTAFMILPTFAREWLDLFLEVSRDRTFIDVEEPLPALGRWYHIMAFPVRRGRVAVVFRDITERKEAEGERAKITRDLQRSNEELQRFVVAAGCDLQEPLRAIVSFSQLLEQECRGRLGTDADEYIRFIVAGGLRMERLIEGLLRLSRIEATARPPAPTDAGEVVAGVLRSMAAPIRQAGATVTVEDLPTVMADQVQLAQVFEILVGNAITYRRPGDPPEVRISARRADPLLRFAVQDNGIGIAPEYLDRIFAVFSRLHTRDEYEGAGIGLAVARKIVDRHGGKIWAESRPGAGSTFFFTLPAA